MEHNLVHFRLKQVFEMNKIVGAERVYLTHMPGFMDYRTLEKELPEGYAPSHDGLVLEARL
jgi:phosphoribosyl 1,2-cyclic phosphodiesterase